MKCLKPLFSAELASHITCSTSRWIGVPSNDETDGTVARKDQLFRKIGADHAQGISAAHLRERSPHRLEQVAAIVALDQVRDDLRVGLARKDVAARHELGAQRRIVFDDPVM